MRVFTRDDDQNPPRVDEQTRTHPNNEWAFEDLLNANPDLLLDETLLVFGRQCGLDTGVLDLLALDQYGNTVVIEVKQGESGSGSASEATILSQPQNYAQSLSTYGYDDLNDIYHEYRTDDWYVTPVVETADTLSEAFEQTFSTTLEPDEFNEYQRMVILAESITRRTMMNARYLLEEGLNVQCVEVQQFRSETETSTVATSTVVDYSLKRVQPEREGAPKHPDTARKIAERSFEELSGCVNATTYHEVFKGFDSYEPTLLSDAVSHPDGVRYVLHLRPLEWGSVGVAMQVRDQEALQTVREHAAAFEDKGFDVHPDRSRHRVVTHFWRDADTPSRLSDDEFLEEVATRFATLVRTGHEVFEMADTNESVE